MIPARGRWSGGTIRRITPDDLAACVDVFYAASDELHERMAQPVIPRNTETMTRMFGYLVESDPDRCRLAESDGRTVGFGIAHRRADAWFLAFLFVLPEAQALGIGHELIAACLEADAEDVTAARLSLGVCAEAIQPVSQALYARLGMLPRTPLYLLTGRPREGTRLAAVHDLASEPFEELAARDHAALAALVDDLDGDALGYAHPQDHRFFRQLGRQGILLRDSGSGTVVGYGYVHPSGRIGPVAMRDARWLPEAFDHLLARIEPPEAYQIFVPGPSAALALLLEAGLRLDGAPAVYQSSRLVPAFDRYVVNSPALL